MMNEHGMKEPAEGGAAWPVPGSIREGGGVSVGGRAQV